MQLILNILLVVVGLAATVPLSAISAPAKHASTPGNWHYNAKTDAMGIVTKTACTISLNEVRLGFPYGNTKARLCVRPPVEHQNDLEVFVELIGRGQIVTDEGVQTKFDQEEPGGFLGYGSADGSSDTIWLGDSYDALIEIRHAKKTIMEITFFQAGTQALKFNTGGLVLGEVGECERDPALSGFNKGIPSKQAWCQSPAKARSVE